MTLKQKLEDELKKAMKLADEDRKRTIRLILASVKMAEIDRGKSADDPLILSILQKEVKIRNEALDSAITAKRVDLSDQANNELKILNEFLPQQLTDSEILKMVSSAARSIGAITPSDTGKIMKIIMSEAKGRATGDRVSRIVREFFEKS